MKKIVFSTFQTATYFKLDSQETRKLNKAKAGS